MPKPAVPILGQSLIARALDVLRAQGVDDLHVNLWHLPAALDEILQRERRGSAKLTTHVEEELLGTAGGVANALGTTSAGDALIYNGDVLYLGELAPLWQIPVGIEAPLAMLGLVRSPDPIIPRSVIVGADGRIVEFLNRDRARNDAWTFSGIQWVSAELLAEMPDRGCIVADLYTKLLDTGRIVGVPLDGYWADLGTLERLFEVYMDLLHRPDLMAWIRPKISDELEISGIVVHKNCEVGEGAKLVPPCVLESGVIVGTGAVVGPDVYLGSDCVVETDSRVQGVVALEGSRLGGRCEDEVFWSGGATKVSNLVLRDKPGL